ncbi:MAG: hypothetical protein A2516_11325 [Alphaproteobacteria bacterium RIFOXYD12_FULL_60_8]|nr:MAG: hypothetical protein A2516_11325 [Alphaproteobacteria bacterium RIFOXYD12_FULL_60_8]
MSGLCETPPLMDRVGSWRRALVVFSGQTDLPWLRALKPGYRHCFVSLSDGARWITLEPLSHCTEISHYPDTEGFDMKAFYLSHGLTVVETRLRKVPRACAPLWFSTCVEGVKRVLGLHEPWIITPYQLYRFLTSEKNLVVGKDFACNSEQIVYT